MPAQPTALRELCSLLSDGQLKDDRLDAAVNRALLALDDPESYLTHYPDDEWVVEGLQLDYELDADYDEARDAALRLLHWVLWQELGAWLIVAEKPAETGERIIDRLSEHGIALADPPSHLRTLDEYCEYFNIELAALRAPHVPRALFAFDSGCDNRAGLFIANLQDRSRIVELSQQLHLRIAATRGAGSWARQVSI
jgi:hypothetical protein